MCRNVSEIEIQDLMFLRNRVINVYAKEHTHMAEFTPEKCKQIALARLDIVHKWLEFRKKSQNKLQPE